MPSCPTLWCKKCPRSYVYHLFVFQNYIITYIDTLQLYVFTLVLNFNYYKGCYSAWCHLGIFLLNIPLLKFIHVIACTRVYLFCCCLIFHYINISLFIYLSFPISGHLVVSSLSFLWTVFVMTILVHVFYGKCENISLRSICKRGTTGARREWKCYKIYFLVVALHLSLLSNMIKYSISKWPIYKLSEFPAFEMLTD